MCARLYARTHACLGQSKSGRRTLKVRAFAHLAATKTAAAAAGLDAAAREEQRDRLLLRRHRSTNVRARAVRYEDDGSKRIPFLALLRVLGT